MENNLLSIQTERSIKTQIYKNMFLTTIYTYIIWNLNGHIFS